MAMIKYRANPAKPAKLTPEQRAYHAALTDEEITAIAEADPDNPPIRGDEASRFIAVRLIKRTRERLGLTQAMFAKRYQINLGRLRDLEQGRFTPDSAMLAYLRVIASKPDLVAKVLTSRAA
jgi:putative transcriptional regulator